MIGMKYVDHSVRDGNIYMRYEADGYETWNELRRDIMNLSSQLQPIGNNSVIKYFKVSKSKIKRIAVELCNLSYINVVYKAFDLLYLDYHINLFQAKFSPSVRVCRRLKLIITNHNKLLVVVCKSLIHIISSSVIPVRSRSLIV